MNFIKVGIRIIFVTTINPRKQMFVNPGYDIYACVQYENNEQLNIFYLE